MNHHPHHQQGKRQARSGQAGFTLLLAAIAASIALTLGTSIFSISAKQIQLSSIGRDSQYAFYAADAAAECALYWDIRFSYFGTSTPPDPQDQYKCAGQAITSAGRPAPNDPTPYPYTVTTQLELNGRCVNISVLKCQGTISPAGLCTLAPPAIRTLVHADGFNTSCAQIGSLQALQRSVELRY